jgi:protein SCO1
MQRLAILYSGAAKMKAALQHGKGIDLGVSVGVRVFRQLPKAIGQQRADTRPTLGSQRPRGFQQTLVDRKGDVLFRGHGNQLSPTRSLRVRILNYSFAARKTSEMLARFDVLKDEFERSVTRTLAFAPRAGARWGGGKARRFFFNLGLVGALAAGSQAATAADTVLPSIGAAADFSLTTQDKRSLTLRELRGKVVAVTFIFTQCRDTCPMLTAKLVGIERKLAVSRDADIRFVAISLTPKHDTPEVLKRYAQAYSADLSRWAFLTGDAAQIHDLARQYGVFVRKKETQDDVDHGFLTSLVDRAGNIRVQYMGTRFEPAEMLADLRALAQE